MSPEQWRKVETFFDELHELSPEQRTAGVAAIPDGEVRHEVSTLLMHLSSDLTIANIVAAMAVKARKERG